jgi:UDP-N-acetylmuramate dehydrogenase
MKGVVSAVEAYDVANDRRVTYTNAECRFGYRDSRFKHEPHLILKTTLTLEPGDPAECKRKIEEIMAKRKESQPQGAFTAGCLFKNFEYADDAALDILKRQGDDIPAAMLAQKRIGAGWLIDKLGLKGTTVGKAQVSPVHGNFLVNLGGARAQDVLALSSLVKMKVRDELGILLEDEVQYLGF